MDAVMLKQSDFVRVKRDADFRPGQDGMVMAPQDEEGHVGLLFHYDRYGEANRTESVGIELWHVDELDLSSIDRSPIVN
jgi:hypothetical protein